MANIVNLSHDNVDDFNKNVSNPNMKSIRFLQWNVRGLNVVGKFDDVLEFIDNVCVPLDVIVLGETMLKDANCSLLNMRGFSAIFSCRENSSGGLALFIRNTIDFRTIKNVSVDGFHHIHIELKLNGIFYDVHGVYRPPSYDFNSFHTMLEAWLAEASPSRPLLIFGDINIPMNLVNNNVVVKYKNLLECYGCLCTNTHVTRPLSNNILDHVVCKLDNASSIQNDTIYSAVSDHLPVLTSLSLSAEVNRVELSQNIIDHGKVNVNFSNYINSIGRIDDVNTCLENIIENYNKILQDCTTVRKKSVNIKGTQCPWMSLNLWQLIKLKNKYLKKFKRNPTDQYIKSMLDHLSKKVEKTKRSCKRAYYENILNNTTHSKLWKHINILFGRNSKPKQSFLVVNERHIMDDREKCELFNDFFSNIGGSLASQIPHSERKNPISNVNRVRESIYLRPSTPNEIACVISALKTNKAPGPDNIPTNVVKTNALAFSRILNNCFNKMVETGIYPDCLKLAKVTPIFKSGDPSLLDNYRPISTLSVFNKVFEKLLANRLIDFFERNQVLYAYQYGFRQACSTATAITELVDFVLQEIDSKKIVGALFIDLKKAFDTLNHDILLKKLYAYGIRGIVFDLFKNYLTNRRQYVCLNGYKSAIGEVNNGVPQGSNIGPLLFLVYINDLGNLPLKGVPRLFADDTALFYPSNNPQTVIDHMNSDLQKLKSYFSNNLLSLNIKKTKYMIFRSSRKILPEHLDPKLDGDSIEKVDSFKYLGIFLDSKFSWEVQISHIERKISSLCGILSRVQGFVPRHVSMKFYYAHIHSLLQYIITVWGRACKSRLMRLQVLQNRCLKIIFRLPHLYPTFDLYANLSHNILPLLGLCELQTLHMVHKIRHNSRTHSNIVLNTIPQTRTTRQAGNLALIRAASNQGQRRFSYVGPLKYNALPNDLKLIINSNLFKFKIKKYLKGKINDFLL